jgi:hypothetical protein
MAAHKLNLASFLYKAITLPAKKLASSFVEVEIPYGYKVSKPVAYSPDENTYHIIIEVQKI